MRDITYNLAYLIPLSGWLALEYKGPWSWATLILAFVIIPLLDGLLPVDASNGPQETERKRSSNFYFDALLYLCAPVCWFITWKYFEVMANTPLELSETIGLTLGTGVVLGATGINVAHELGHRSNRVARLFAKAGLLPVLYQHFYVEHNRGHHKYVATPQDPATARFGENVYSFFVRTIPAQYRNAWEIESARLRKDEIPFWNLKNSMLRFSLYNLSYLVAVAAWFGPVMVPFALAIALTGVLLLELINYIEHYGLLRNRLPDGSYERVMPRHSWNSDHRLGRVMLFELTRHSDHHYMASRKYQILRHLDDSPQLPTGYPGSMLLALVPPFWFAVMNPRLRRFGNRLS